MTTRREGAEWLAMAYGKGYRDGQSELPPMRSKTLARWLIGPAFDMGDAKALRGAYMLGYSIAGQQTEQGE